MYYRLNKINVENISRKPERFNVLSEVVDSGISFESPTIVDTVEELELWFGKSFKEHDYFCKLLGAGVSLYLYKPVQTPRSSFISGFEEVREFDVRFPLVSLPEKGEKGVKYLIGIENKTEYIWTGIRWMKLDEWNYVSEGKYQRTITRTKKDGGVEEKIETIEITKTVEFRELSEGIATLSQVENGTKAEDRIGKIYVLPEGERYIWYEWIRLADLRKLPDFNESEYKTTIETESLPKITDKNREELGKIIYKLPEIGEVILFGDSTWMNADYFPQTIENTSPSLNNRDTLLITPKDFTGPKYIYPKYNNRDKKLIVGEELGLSSPIELATPGDIGGIVNGSWSYVFNLEFPESISDGYIVIPNTNNELVLIYRGVELEEIRKKIPESFASTAKSFRTKSAFLKILEELGYTKVDESTYISPVPIWVIYCSDIPGLRFSPDINSSLNYINATIEDSSDNIEVWSRCIGKDSDIYDDTQRIIFTIEEGTLDGYYRVIVEKYGYSEVFEAPITGEDCLEYKINRNSKLIRCNLKSKNIRLGTYVLYGGVDESKQYSPETYCTSLNEMFKEQCISLYPDFLLVPDVKKFGTEKGENLSYCIYDRFLKIAKENRLQVLIQNELQETTIEHLETLPDIGVSGVIYEVENKYYAFGESEWKEIVDPEILQPMLSGGDFVFNLLEDENYLVYFLSSIQDPYGKKLPGYSLFLDEFLSGTYNDFVSENIIYPKVSLDPYTNESFEKILAKYKSNYLTINNHRYYYKKYLSGEKYKFTILRQFILGKIYRELMKLSRTLLAKRKKFEIESLISEKLNNIKTRFSSVISGLSVVECDLDLQKNKLTLKVESSLKELVEEDILLDITINYNENGNSIAIS